jgi:hypothetical protein
MRLLHRALGQALDTDASNLATGFDGTQYLIKDTNVSDMSTAGLLSIGAWVRLNTLTGTQTIISKWRTESTPDWSLEYILFYTGAQSRFQFGVSNNGTNQVYATASTFGAPSINTWYFVQAWTDGTNASISVNDGTADTNSFSASLFNGPASFRMGTWDSNGTPTAYFDGRIDSAYMAKSNIGSTLRTSLYNSGNGRKWSQLSSAESSNFYAWWDMNETTGLPRVSTVNNIILSNIGGATQEAGVTI